MVLDNVSWGEIFILVGVGISFIGRKDLPVASKHLGRQVGRVVGLLVGGRQRLDMYAANNELSKLQNELRMGLRELDAIKTEMAVASSVGMRQLGSTVGGSKLRIQQPTIIQQSNHQTVSSSSVSNSTTKYISNDATNENNRSFRLPHTNSSTQYSLNSVEEPNTSTSLAETDRNSTASLAMRAIAEDEWNKRGIGFKSRAEQGTTTFKTSSTTTAAAATTTTNSTLPEPLRHHATIPLSGGSAILAELIQNNLIYDQYDRITQEQEEILRPNRTKSEEADEDLKKVIDKDK